MNQLNKFKITLSGLGAAVLVTVAAAAIPHASQEPVKKEQVPETVRKPLPKKAPKVMLAKAEDIALPHYNKRIELAVDMDDLPNACGPDSILKFKVEGRDMTYAQADSVLYHPASEVKAMLPAFVGYLAEHGILSLDDDVEITEDATTYISSRDNLFSNYKKYTPAQSRQFIGQTYKLKTLLRYAEDQSAGDVADAILEYAGKRILENKQLDVEPGNYKEQRAALAYAMYFLRHEVGVSRKFQIVNASGDIGWQVNYARLQDGHRTSPKNKGSTNVYSALDGCRILKYTAQHQPHMLDYLRNGHQFIDLAGGFLRVKTGTMTYDAGVRVAVGYWSMNGHAVFSMVSAPCRRVNGGCQLDVNNNRKSMLASNLRWAMNKISKPEYQLARLNRAVPPVLLARATTVPANAL